MTMPSSIPSAKRGEIVELRRWAGPVEQEISSHATCRIRELLLSSLFQCDSEERWNIGKMMLLNEP